jgi:hypothetical protein
MANRTLGQLRRLLVNRLGFALAQADSGSIAALADNFITYANTLLYWELDWPHLETRATRTLAADATTLNFTDTFAVFANQQRILEIAINLGDASSPSWQPVDLAGVSLLEEGNNAVAKSRVYKAQIDSVIRFERPADQDYSVRVRGITDLTSFIDVDDRPQIDDNLVFLLALANAKAHYKRPDAKTYADQFSELFGKLKSKRGWRQSVFSKARPHSPMLDDPYHGNVPLVKV